MIPVIRFLKNEKYSLCFYYTSDRCHIFISDTCFVPKPEKNMKKKYALPSYWKNLVRGRRVAKISKQHKSLE